MDPASLDFRGTWTLAVAPDGTIDPDGFAGAPATVDDLLATYGAAATASGDAAGSAAPRLTSAPPVTGAPGTPEAPVGSGDGGAGGAGLAGLLAVVAIAALAAARVRAVRRRRRRTG
jgi:hypothetical protein